MKNKIKIALWIECFIYFLCLAAVFVGWLVDTTKYEFIHYLKIFGISFAGVNALIFIVISFVIIVSLIEEFFKNEN
jgi:hypothetical protein